MGDVLFPSREKIQGELDHIIFQNEENGYTVALFKAEGRSGTVRVTGELAGVSPGETLLLKGAWVRHPRFGLQFKADEFEIIYPATRKGIIKYLSSGFVKGIGPKLSVVLVNKFGSDTLEVIGKTPEKLLEVSGIGKKRIAMIEKAWAKHAGIRDAIVFFRGYGLGASHTMKVLKRYGNDAVSVVKKNPYRLTDEIFGIGFKTADSIALNLGVEKSSPFRIRAALEYLMNEASSEGHMCLPYPDVLKMAGEVLGLDAQPIVEEIESLGQGGPIVIEEKVESPGELSAGESGAQRMRMVFARYLRDAEVTVHTCLRRLKHHAKWSVPIDVERAVNWAEQRTGLELEASQRDAVAAALKEPVLIITGGPGVGKTTIINCITKILLRKKYDIALAAPTGRAAKRLSESTGLRASTIHRLLGFNPHSYSFEHDEKNPLTCNVLVVDESSMVDTVLMEKLVRALDPTARLILVGDVDQLPSVGPGELLRSLIECGKFAKKRLTKLFRQDEGGGITLAAHEVNSGGIPRFTAPGEDGEIFFVDEPEPERAAMRVVELVGDRIPDRFGIDPMTGIQVLTPMHKGAAGTENLNSMLQEAMNPAGSEVSRFGRTYRAGDKVMQIRNNYTLDVFNGDIGFVHAIDSENKLLRVRMDERVVEYGFDDLDELQHAYCVTVHKSQGSEFPAVVIPLLTQHYIMLRRNLIYTGITRARKLLVIVGSQKAVRLAVANTQTGVRHSLLEERLRLDPGL